MQAHVKVYVVEKWLAIQLLVAVKIRGFQLCSVNFWPIISLFYAAFNANYSFGMYVPIMFKI